MCVCVRTRPCACVFDAIPSLRFIFEDYTPTNFDTFPAAIMTVFQVCKTTNTQTTLTFL